VAIPFTALGGTVGLVPPPAGIFFWLLGTLLAYYTLAQEVKVWYIPRFGMWL